MYFVNLRFELINRWLNKDSNLFVFTAGLITKASFISFPLFIDGIQELQVSSRDEAENISDYNKSTRGRD